MLLSLSNINYKGHICCSSTDTVLLRAAQKVRSWKLYPNGQCWSSNGRTYGEGFTGPSEVRQQGVMRGGAPRHLRCSSGSEWLSGKSHRRLQSCTVREISQSHHKIEGPIAERGLTREGSQCPTHCQDIGCSVYVASYGLQRRCFTCCPARPLLPVKRIL